MKKSELVELVISGEAYLLPMKEAAVIMGALRHALKAERDWETNIKHASNCGDIAIREPDHLTNIFDPKEKTMFKKFLDTMQAEKKLVTSGGSVFEAKSFEEWKALGLGE